MLLKGTHLLVPTGSEVRYSVYFDNTHIAIIFNI